MDKETRTFLTVPEVARQLLVKAITVRRWIQDGILEAEAIQEGRRHRYRILKQTVDALNVSRKWQANTLIRYQQK
jgi:excisionase family DNA binding protein